MTEQPIDLVPVRPGRHRSTPVPFGLRQPDQPRPGVAWNAVLGRKCGREASLPPRNERPAGPGTCMAPSPIPAPIWRAARQGLLRRHSWTGGWWFIAAFCTGQSGVGGPLVFLVRRGGGRLPSERFLWPLTPSIETRNGWCLEGKDDRSAAVGTCWRQCLLHRSENI